MTFLVFDLWLSLTFSTLYARYGTLSRSLPYTPFWLGYSLSFLFPHYLPCFPPLYVFCMVSEIYNSWNNDPFYIRLLSLLRNLRACNYCDQSPLLKRQSLHCIPFGVSLPIVNQFLAVTSLGTHSCELLSASGCKSLEPSYHTTGRLLLGPPWQNKNQ